MLHHWVATTYSGRCGEHGSKQRGGGGETKREAAAIYFPKENPPFIILPRGFSLPPVRIYFSAHSLGSEERRIC